MKEIIDFLVANVNGKTLYTKELVYQLEDGGSSFDVDTKTFSP